MLLAELQNGFIRFKNRNIQVFLVASIGDSKVGYLEADDAQEENAQTDHLVKLARSEAKVRIQREKEIECDTNVDEEALPYSIQSASVSLCVSRTKLRPRRWRGGATRRRLSAEAWSE